MRGRRAYDGVGGAADPDALQAGEFGRFHGSWWVKTPSGELCELRMHEIVEHKGGDISVRPAIKVIGPRAWHGLLSRGEWTATEEKQ